jgi:hypothetical protein
VFAFLISGVSAGMTMTAGRLRKAAAAATPLGMIARRIGHDAAALRLLAEAGNEVPGAAELERSGALQAFRLDEDAPAQCGVEQWRLQHGRDDGLPRRRERASSISANVGSASLPSWPSFIGFGQGES